MQKWWFVLSERGALLAINLLFATVWGCAGMSKLQSGVPSWFGEKFGQTFLARFPGLSATFWLLALSEMLGFALSIVALGRLEFFTRKPVFLNLTLVWSLFIFTQLSLGQWLTSDFNSTAQLFAYFAGSLLSLMYVNSIRGDRVTPSPVA